MINDYKDECEIDDEGLRKLDEFKTSVLGITANSTTIIVHSRWFNTDDILGVKND